VHVCQTIVICIVEGTIGGKEQSREKRRLLHRHCISDALKPLILKVQQLKTKMLSLKKKNLEFSSQITQNQTKILKKNKNNSLKAPLQPSQIADKATLKTIKKTFAEIAKLNSLVTKQSIKLDK
jgi:hypothetical protein